MEQEGANFKMQSLSHIFTFILKGSLCVVALVTTTAFTLVSKWNV